MFQLTDYDYTLPEELISQSPTQERDASRLMAMNRTTGEISHEGFAAIEEKLLPGDVLVVNNTEVIPGRLYGRKESGGKVELLILDYPGGRRMLAEKGVFTSKCLIRASKRPKTGTSILFEHGLSATVLDFTDGVYMVRLDFTGDLDHLLDRIGSMPLPPYIRRNEGEAPCDDKRTYQTVYAENRGAIAAPTAGLHFTDALLGRLAAKGVKIVAITLHVGYGTFLPVRVTDIREHAMHTELYTVGRKAAEAINGARENGNRVVAVGTTSVRTLEYVADEAGRVTEGSGSCDIFIYPGYRFKAVDAMITNFHLPQSTLLMLVSAFAGHDNVFSAYREAVANRYRFFSYGDAMFIS